MPERFGRYEILTRIAAGGMGEVFRARLVGAAGFEKPIALKRVFEHLSSDPTYVQPLIREAKVTARLVHPNIVQVYELGLEQGQLYVAMELVEGSDLAKLQSYMRDIGGGGPDIPVLLLILRDVLDGLAFAHGFTDDDGTLRPIIHRDISPQNILLAPNGAAKICDFGIARGAITDTTRVDLFAGLRVGKLAYMPPEQARGLPVDGRADLFALGVTLWAAASGYGFYGAADLHGPLQRGEKLPQRRLREVWAEAPEDFAALLDRAVELDPQARWRSAADMKAATDAILAKHDVAAARERLRSMIHDIRHTVIARTPVPSSLGDSGPRTVVDVAAALDPTTVARSAGTPPTVPSHPAPGRQERSVPRHSGATVAEARPAPTPEKRRTTKPPQPEPAAPAPAAAAPQQQPSKESTDPTRLLAVSVPPPPPPRSSWALSAVLIGALLGALFAGAWLGIRNPRAPRQAALVELTPRGAAAKPVAAAPSSRQAAADPLPSPAAAEPRSLPPVAEARLRPAMTEEPAPAPTAPPATPAARDKGLRPERRRGPMGYLTLETTPPAKVSIDGEALGKSTPLTRHPVPVGKRYIMLQRQGGQPVMLVVEIEEGVTASRSVTLE